MKKAKKTRTTRRKAAPVLEAEPQPVLQIDPVPEPEQKYELEVVDTPPEDGQPAIQPIAATALDLSYMCYGNTAMTAVPVDAIPSGLTALKMKGAFQGCTGLKSIPDTIKDKFKNSAKCSLENMFQGCTGITEAVPEWWKTLQSTKHTDCFKGYINVKNYPLIPKDWGGDANMKSVKFYFYIESDNYTLDLSTFIFGNGYVDWGDGTLEKMVNNPGTHRYKYSKSYWVQIFSSSGLTLKKLPHNHENLLERIEIPGESPIISLPSNAFSYYENLHSVPSNLLSGLQVTSTTLDLSRMFFNTRVSGVPDHFFAGLPDTIQTLNLTEMFSVPSIGGILNKDLFAGHPKNLVNLNMTRMFWDASATSIDSNFLQNLPKSLKVLNMTGMFQGLTTSAREGCTIAEDLFHHLPTTLTTINMTNMFQKAYIKWIRSDLIPASLVNRAALTSLNLYGMFDQVALWADWDGAAPNDLFKGVQDNAKLNLNNMFTNLTTSPDVNKIRYPFLGILPRIWKNFPSQTLCRHEGCFSGCAKAQNYSEVPSDWK